MMFHIIETFLKCWAVGGDCLPDTINEQKYYNYKVQSQRLKKAMDDSRSTIRKYKRC